MVTMVVSTFLALASAAAVLVVASVAGGRGPDQPAGPRAYVADVRAGLRTWRSERRGAAAPVQGPAPVDTTLQEILDTSTAPDPAYLGVEDLTETLARARERAARGVGGLTRR
jgi:hypothetical protein